jgi:hypothetical protein
VRDLPSSRREIGLVPILTGDSDLGLGLGAMLSWTRFEDDDWPFAWQVQVMVFVTVRLSQEGLQTAYHDDFVKLDLPALL